MNRIKFKYLAIVLVLFLFFGNAEIFAQNLNKKITIKAKNKTLEQVLNEISSKSGIHFSYSPQSINADRKISVSYRNKSVKHILDRICKDNSLTYSLIENQVVIKPVKKETIPDDTVKKEKEERYTISGYIRDKISGEVLIGAHVFAKGTPYGTATNHYGFYSLNLPPGKYKLVFSYMGYKEIVASVQLNSSKSISKDLEYEPVIITPVKVEEKEKDSVIILKKISKTDITGQDLEKLPGFGGDEDIVKSFQAIPGIRSYGDGSSIFYVRGGNSDQNLILVDEAPIYNTSHLFGFFSALAPDAVNKADIYKGDYPAKYGGRLSSVIDIKIKEGNMHKWGGSGSLGPYTTWLSVEGPLKKNKASMFLAGRKSHINWLANIGSQVPNTDVAFTDFNLKLNFKPGTKNRYYFSLYGGTDNYDYIANNNIRTFGINWKNNLASFRWNHLYNSKLFSNTTFYYSIYDYYMYLSKEENNYWNSSIGETALKSDFTYFLNPSNTIRAGLQLSGYRSDPGNLYLSNAEDQKYVPKVSKYKSREFTLYASNEQKIGKKLMLNYGFRMPIWNDIGETTVYAFNTNHEVVDTFNFINSQIYKSFLSLEPKISLRYSLTKKHGVKLAYNRNSQFLHILSNSVSPFTSLDVWVPSGPNIEPQKADIMSFGMSSPEDQKWRYDFEFYYKKFHNCIDYADHANMLFNPLIEGELRFGTGEAYGAEFKVEKTKGKYTWWISYVYSRSFKTIEGVNNGNRYPTDFDSPHNIYFHMTYDAGKRVRFSANWMYLTGKAYTTPIGFYYIDGYTVPVYGEKNNDRLPNYHRLDLSLTLRLSKPERKYQHSLILSVYNFYGRQNPFSVNFNKIVMPNGNIVVPSDYYTSHNIQSTMISVAGMIPSINYKFNF